MEYIFALPVCLSICLQRIRCLTSSIFVLLYAILNFNFYGFTLVKLMDHPGLVFVYFRSF